MAARILVLAGEDSSGFSGVAADLKTFSLFGVTAAPVITASTRQSATEFYSSDLVPLDQIRQGLAQAFEKGIPAVVKTGMLGTAAVVDTLVTLLEQLPPSSRPALVVDPVMESSSGGELLDVEGREALAERLLPLATIVTPNALEAASLAGSSVPVDTSELLALGQRLLSLGSRAVYMKSGHLQQKDCTDILVQAAGNSSMPSVPRVSGGPFRGTGCTLASAMAASLALGMDIESAARRAQLFTACAIRKATKHNFFSSLGHEEAARELNL
jgi:hydroxymethylpyrimidine/phosphomethylpyrimidine kinase